MLIKVLQTVNENKDVDYDNRRSVFEAVLFIFEMPPHLTVSAEKLKLLQISPEFGKLNLTNYFEKACIHMSEILVGKRWILQNGCKLCEGPTPMCFLINISQFGSVHV